MTGSREGEVLVDSVSEARLSLICPTLADKIRTMSTMLEQESIVIRVVQGLRSWQEQDALYAQGRTAPGKVVTNVKGGYSQHCFGLAVDLVIMGAENIPDWNIQHPAWSRMIACGKSLGLVSGSEWRTFPDNPHFELTGRWPSTPDDEERQIFKDGGMQAVWDEADL